MSKRSAGKFERRPRDAYATPRAAVKPLIPWLRGVRTFAEPCCGDGALVRHLESFGLRCAYQGDIVTGQDALGQTDYGGAKTIITNPPWSRPVLHRLIPHFSAIAPTWLLLDADWASTRQAVDYLSHCSDILAIGRVKWIAGSLWSGKDNAAWYRFDARHAAGPLFHPFRSAPPASRYCAQCGAWTRGRQACARQRVLEGAA